MWAPHDSERHFVEIGYQPKFAPSKGMWKVLNGYEPYYYPRVKVKLRSQRSNFYIDKSEQKGAYLCYYCLRNLMASLYLGAMSRSF